MEEYDNCNEEEKEKLLEHINEEKTKSAKMIIQLNKEMTKMYRDYESQLRNNQD